MEADLVAHSGPMARGSFVQTLVLTDIATGWTECAPLLVREQTVLIEVLIEVRKGLPFDLLGFDTDNDTVFMDETVRDYCRMAGIEFTRCRPYRRTACCTEKEEAREPPFPTDDQATRTEFGCPRSSIWLSTAAAMATSVVRASSLWKRSPSPMTCFQRANWPSTRAL
jgi:hypothetical protein